MNNLVVVLNQENPFLTWPNTKLGKKKNKNYVAG